MLWFILGMPAGALVLILVVVIDDCLGQRKERKQYIDYKLRELDERVTRLQEKMNERKKSKSA